MMRNNILEYKGYHAKIEYDADDNIFVGEVLGISDILAFHSETTRDLPKHFHDCIENYLELCKQCGDEPEKECSGVFSVRVTPEEQRKAKICAAAKGISLNKYYGLALEAYNHINYK